MRTTRADKFLYRFALAILLVVAVGWVLGGCKQRQRKISYSGQADEAFQKGANRAPTPRTLYSLAKIFATQGKERQCRYVLVRIIREQPDFVPAYCELAELYMRQGQVQMAADTLKAARKQAPRDPVLMNNLGLCYLLRDEHADAETMFAAAAGERPSDARYRANLAVAIGMTGRYDEALLLFKQLMSEKDAYYNLGVICEARNDRQGALEAFDKCEEIHVALIENGVEQAVEAVKKVINH